MSFIVNVYLKDTRTKSGRRLISSTEYVRRDVENLKKELNDLYPAFNESDGYMFEII